MKIAVNGNIIDTEHIYKITPLYIQKELYFMRFYIKLFNNKDIEVFKTTGIYYHSVGDTLEIKNIEKYIKITRKEALLRSEYVNSLKDITNFRDSIIKIWKDNQSTIPQFNL